MDEAINYMNNVTKVSAVKKLPWRTQQSSFFSLISLGKQRMPGTIVTLILYVDVFFGNFGLPSTENFLFYLIA